MQFLHFELAYVMDTGAVVFWRKHGCSRFLSPSVHGMATGAVGSSFPVHTNSRSSVSAGVIGNEPR
eukprot:8559860-Lingulodinium_polyedra.AAC.1